MTPVDRVKIVLGLSLFILIFPACRGRSPDLSSKVLNYPLVTDIKGFDPIQADDQYSNVAASQVYQSLLQYKYLMRPYELEPLLAESMPIISKDGLTYTFH